MSHEKNIALSMRWFEEVWNQKLESTIYELYDPNCVAHLEPMDVHGLSAFLKQREIILALFPDLKINVESIMGDGDETAARWTITGTHLGNALGLQPSSREFKFRGITWLRFKDGMIVEGWDSWNQAGLIQQLKDAPKKTRVKIMEVPGDRKIIP